MDTLTAGKKSTIRSGANIAAVPFAVIIFGFYGTFLPFGVLGIAGFALAGLLWAMLLGFAAKRLLVREAWRERLANAPVFVSIIALGLLIGGGVMYIFMMLMVLEEPSLTSAALSALMQPAVPYFIAINTTLELFVMLFVIFFNWDVDRMRRNYSLIGVGLYLAMRIWTYLVYAENRLLVSTGTLSAADVAWFIQTLRTDYRVVLELLAQASLILAAMIPARSGGEPPK